MCSNQGANSSDEFVLAVKFQLAYSIIRFAPTSHSFIARFGQFEILVRIALSLSYRRSYLWGQGFSTSNFWLLKDQRIWESEHMSYLFQYPTQRSQKRRKKCENMALFTYSALALWNKHRICGIKDWQVGVEKKDSRNLFWTPKTVTHSTDLQLLTKKCWSKENKRK